MGDDFGTLELFPASRRVSTIAAIRQSHALCLQQVSLRFLSHQYPTLLSHFLESLGSLMQSSVGKSISNSPIQVNRVSNGVHTVAIVSIDGSLLGKRFALSLAEAFRELGIGSRSKAPPIFSAANTRDLPSAQAFATYGIGMLDHYLSQVENNANLAIYLSDSSGDISWAKTCVSRVRKSFALDRHVLIL